MAKNLLNPEEEFVEASGPTVGEEERKTEAERMKSYTQSGQAARSREAGLAGLYPKINGKTRLQSILTPKRPTPTGIDEPDRRSRLAKILEPPSPSPYPLTLEAEGLAAPGDKNRLDVNVVDFLFGGEMAVIGMKYDNAGLHWNLDIAKQQWSEQPVWLNLLNTTSLIGTMAFPAARAAITTAKFGKVATLTKRLKGLSQADEIKYFQDLGILEKETEITSKTLELARRQEIYRSRYQDLSTKLDKASRGEANFTLAEKIRFQFDKRFANRYFEIAGSLVDGNEHVRDVFYKNLDELFRAEDIGRFFINVPDETAGVKIYQHWLSKMRPGLVEKVKLSPNERQWADSLESAMRSHQQDALESGMLSATTISKVGEMHIPALYKGTPRPDLSSTRKYYVPSTRKPTKRELAEGLTKDDQIEILRPFEMPRLDSPSLKPRKKELPEVADRLLKGELITDPTELTVHGYVMDRLLLNNYKAVTNIATNSRYSIGAHDVLAKYGSRRAAEKAGYVSLDNLQGNIPTTLKRMIQKKNPSFLGNAEELPWIRRSVYEDLFGEAGVFAQTQMAGNILHVATVVHKTAKTALSIPTHFQNLLSNMVMLSQAGFNILSPENIKISQRMASEFNKLANAHKKANEIAKATGVKTSSKIHELGVNLGKIKIGKKTFNLNDELLDPRVRELIEESAFENVEGFESLRRMSEKLPDGIPKSFAKTMIGVKPILQLGDRKGFRWFDQMTKWYLGEDMVPKMTYYMGLRAKGLTKEAAILEVGRRLPMYGTVGSAIKGARKLIFPWATFPTEALRITKNNIMDHPLRLLPWLHMPSIIQSFSSSFGGGPVTREEVESAKRQLPMWAQTSQTVITSKSIGDKIGAGLTGAGIGGVAGALKGGAPGALIGAGLGAAAGIAGSEFLSENETSDQLRGAIIDFLPHASFYFTSTSPEFGGDVLPFRDIQGALEQMPAEPLAILKPFIDISYGKTSWGEDIGAYDVGDMIGKTLAGYIGFVSPPFIQKYGLKTTTPDVSASEWLTGEPLPGDITNVSRLLMDSGLKIDPLTGKPGNFTNDMFLKNFGVWKSWATDPANLLANEQGSDLHFQSIRSHASKNLGFYLENGDDQRATETLAFVMATFSNQYADNPRVAQEKYGKWLEQRVRAIGRHPRLRTWSEDEIRNRLIETTRFAGEERGKARDEMMKFLTNQITSRKLQRLKKKEEEGIRQNRNKRGRLLRPKYEKKKSILDIE